jgi:integrase
MATIVKKQGKKGVTYEAQVYVNGVRKTKTLKTKAQAKAWASSIETELHAVRNGAMPKKKIADLLDRYAEEVSPRKKGARWEIVRLNKFKRDPIAELTNYSIREGDITDWQNRRLAEVSESSVNRERNLLSNVFNKAIKEWNWLDANPMTNVARPKRGKPRTSIATDDEIDRLDLALGENGVQGRVRLAMHFAIETAMRAGEIAALTYDDIKGNTAIVRDSKNDEAREVPLNTRAREIVAERLREPHKPTDSLFDLTSMQISSLFRKAKNRCQIEGLTFHDFRRLALTRMSKKVDVMMLSKISGHKDLKILMSHYYSPDMGEIANLLD